MCIDYNAYNYSNETLILSLSFTEMLFSKTSPYVSPFPSNSGSSKCPHHQCRFSEQTYSELDLVFHTSEVHPNLTVEDYTDYQEDDSLLQNNPKLSGKSNLRKLLKEFIF